uniref:Leucine-rich repeat-containing N-terminal plant-type domain-containing protein n=1 Tax=Oryza glaberrima TaxID=4538 RepID=I1NPQ8_ORYGL
AVGAVVPADDSGRGEGVVRVSEDPNCVLSTWRDADNDPCGWPGVTCVDDGGGGRVGGVELANFSLASYLPSELSLPYNQLAGQIPVAITTLQKLAALLAHNLLSSYIPAEIGRQWRLNLGEKGRMGEFPRDPAFPLLRFSARQRLLLPMSLWTTEEEVEFTDGNDDGWHQPDVVDPIPFVTA